MVAPITYYACSGSQLNKHRLWEKWDQGDSTSPVSSDDFFQKCREYPRVDERGGKARMCFIRKELSEVDIKIHALMRLQLFYCCAKQYYGTGRIVLGDEAFLQEFHPDKQEGEQDAHHSLFGYLCDDSFLETDSWDREKILSLWKDAGKSNFDQFTELMRKPTNDRLTLNKLTQNVFALLENLPQAFTEGLNLLKQQVEEGKSIRDLKQFVKGLDEGDLKRNLGSFLQTFGTQDMQERRWKELLLAILDGNEERSIAELLRCYMPRWSILEQENIALIFAMNYTMSAPVFVNDQDSAIEEAIRPVALQKLNEISKLNNARNEPSDIREGCNAIAQNILQNLMKQKRALHADLTQKQNNSSQAAEAFNKLLQQFDINPNQTIIQFLNHNVPREISFIMALNASFLSDVEKLSRFHFENIRDKKECHETSYNILLSYLGQKDVLDRIEKCLGSPQVIENLEGLKKVLKYLSRRNEKLFYEIIVRDLPQDILNKIKGFIRSLRVEFGKRIESDLKLQTETLEMIGLQEEGTQQFLNQEMPFSPQKFHIAFCQQCDKLRSKI